MPNAIIKKYLRFAAAKSISGKAYDDERANYIDRSGLFVSSMSQKQPGKIIGSFYVLDENHEIAKIVTSSGDLKETDEYITVKTGHSIYSFSKDYQLSDKEEQILYEWAIGRNMKDVPLPSERKEEKKKQEAKRKEEEKKEEKKPQKDEKTAKLNRESEKEKSPEKPQEKKTDESNQIEADFPVIAETPPPTSSKREKPPKKDVEKKDNTPKKEESVKTEKRPPIDKTPRANFDFDNEEDEDESPSFFDEEEDDDDGFFDNQEDESEEDDYDEIFGFDETEEEDW